MENNSEGAKKRGSLFITSSLLRFFAVSFRSSLLIGVVWWGEGRRVVVGAAGLVVESGVGVEDGVEVALEDFEEDIGGEAGGAVVVVEGGGETGDAVGEGDDGAEVVGDHHEGEVELLFE